MGNRANRDTKRLDTAARRKRIVDLRKSARRPSLEEIAQEVGCSIATVHRDIATAYTMIEDKTAEAAIALRTIDAEGIAEDLERTERDLGRVEGRLEMLDRVQGIVGPIPCGDDVSADETLMHSLGLSEVSTKVLAQLIDAQTKLIAKRTDLRARRAKMFGVDAPEKVESTLTNTATTPAEARRVMQELFGNVGPSPDDREPPEGASSD